MFHGLINPCIHLIESHQLYIIALADLTVYHDLLGDENLDRCNMLSSENPDYGWVFGNRNT